MCIEKKREKKVFLLTKIHCVVVPLTGQVLAEPTPSVCDKSIILSAEVTCLAIQLLLVN